MLGGPLLQFTGGALCEGLVGLIHLPQQQVQAGQQRLGSFGATRLQPRLGGGNPLGFALAKARCGERCGGQEISSLRACPRGARIPGVIGPAAEQIHLLLHGEEGADLFEKGLEFFARQAWVVVPLQAAPALDQLFEQGQALGALADGGEIAAEQIEHAEGGEALELLVDLMAQGGELAHALQELQTLSEGLGGTFVAAPLVLIGGRRQTGEPGQQGQIRFAAAAQGWRLGRLEGPAGEFETFEGLTSLQKEQQSAHLVGAGHIEGGDGGAAAAGDGGEVGFVGEATVGIAEQVGAGAQQFLAGLEGFFGEPLVWGAVKPLLQGAQNRLGIGGWPHAKQPEVINR